MEFSVFYGISDEGRRNIAELQSEGYSDILCYGISFYQKDCEVMATCI